MISNSFQQSKISKEYGDFYINKRSVVENSQNSAFKFEQIVIKNLQLEDYQQKSKYAAKLASALIRNENVHPFFTSNKFIEHIISQIPEDFYSFNLLNLLAVVLFRREEDFGIELSMKIFQIILYCYEHFIDDSNDFSPVFSMLSYIINENNELLFINEAFIPLIIELTNIKISNKAVSELSSLASVLSQISEISSQLSEEIQISLANCLTNMIKLYEILTPTTISQVINCAAQFLYNRATNNLLKETGFFNIVLNKIHWLDNDMILNDSLTYFSQVLHYSYCEDDEEEEEIPEEPTGFENFDELKILSILISLDSKESNLINSCLLFLIKILPIKIDRINEWFSSGIVEYFISKYEFFNYLERAFFIDLFISILNSANFDLITFLYDLKIFTPILELFSTTVDDSEKISILKMLYKILIIMNENHFTSLNDFVLEIQPIIGEAANSSNQEIENIASEIDSAISGD